MAAAEAALAAGLSDVYVNLGPLVTFDDVVGSDLVIVGHDDDSTDGLAGDYTGEWHDTGAAAVHSGRALVYLTVVSQAGDGLTMGERLAALDALVASVRGVLIPSPVGSALGVGGVLWAQETAVRLHLIPTSAGPLARAVLTYTLATLA